MALIRCPECGHRVSDQASSCPSCGFPLTPQATEKPQATDEARAGFWDYISPVLFLGGGAAAFYFYQRGETKHVIFGVLLCLAGAAGTVRLFMGRPLHGRRRKD